MSLEELKNYFLLFILYSIAGWFVEVLNCMYITKKFVNRGFFIGPYLPIYGFGAIIITIFFTKYINDPVALFCMCMILCCILEYITSFIMEKLFRARWWDYSDKKFNINGRICLETAIPFGIGGCAIIYLINPFFESIINLMPNIVSIIVAVILFLIFITDCCFSFSIMYNFGKLSKDVRKDCTEEVSKKVKQILQSKSIFSRRLNSAFPNFQLKSFKKKN